MPPSVSVAAFVFGLLCIAAAFIGTEVSVKEIKLPKLNAFKRAVLGGFGAVLVVIGLNDGRVPLFSVAASPSIAPSATVQPAGAPAASPTGSVAKIGDIRPLPNVARARVASIKVEYGCVVLFSHAQDNADQLRICQNTPDVPTEWQTKVRRMGADCSSVAERYAIAWVYANANFTDKTWEHAFGC